MRATIAVRALLLAPALACLLAALTGCGHSVKPTDAFRDPSSLPTPSTVRVTQTPGAVVISWDVSGDVYRYVDGWNIYRRTTMDGPRARLNAEPVLDVSYHDSTVAEGGEYFYSVRSVSPAGVESEATHDLWIRYDMVPPEAPQNLGATPEVHAVLLSWSPSAASDLAFYRIYRDGSLIAPDVAAPMFRDMPVPSDRSVRYHVSAVDGNGNESPRSSEVEVTALPSLDTMPPATPTGVAAVTEAAGIRVSWDAVGDPDRAGYFVYRKRPADMDFVRAPGTGLILETEHLDTTVQSGERYQYALTATDSSGNESPRSAVAEAVWLGRVVDTGGTTTGSVYPWCGVVANSGLMQFLIPADHIGRSGTLDTLGLWIQSGEAVYDNVTVTLAHTDAFQLMSGFGSNRASAEPGVIAFGPATVNTASQRIGRIQPFPLSAPFAYDGVRNLLVEISWSGDDGRAVVFGFGSSPGRSLRLWQQPAGASSVGTLDPAQQFIRLVFAP